MVDKNITNKCLICGDKSRGYNYGVLSCVSCKTFFSRNALKNNLKCYLGVKCIIDSPINRRFCKKCRLNKCLEYGMKKEYIEEMARNKTKHKTITTNTENLLNLEPMVNMNKDSMITPTKPSFVINNDIMRIFTEINDNIMIDGNDSYAVDDSNSSHEMIMSVIPRAICDYNSSHLNERENIRIKELLNATKLLKDSISMRVTVEATDIWEESYLWAPKLEREVNNCVQMFKCLNAFNSIVENDRLSLIKYSTTELHYMRLIEYFNLDQMYWTVYTNKEISTIFKFALLKKCNRNVYEWHEKFLKQIIPEWNSDDIIMDLLTAIILFNPNRQGLIYRDVIRLHQYIYTHLLKRYLFIKYGSKYESETKFSCLMSCLQNLRILSQKVVYNFRDAKPKHLGPLLREIYDIQ